MSQTEQDTDRRHYQRYSVRCDCWLEQDAFTLYGTTADLGLGGLFLRSAVPVVDGAQVEVVLDVSGTDQPIVARGLVTRAVRAGRGARHGIGVKFQKFVQGHDALMSFLQSVPHPIAP